MNEGEMEDPARAARLLLRAARSGVLSTAIEGQPFASLVTPATAPDASILLLLSDLSEHTRHLRTDGRCAVMVVGEGDGVNAQTAPRVTITGVAAIDPDPALRARWVALHPYAAFYAGFGDFNLWRVQPMGALYVGGFARAHRLKRTELVAALPEVEAAEAGVISHCNADHAGMLDEIAHAAGLAGDGWLLAACDGDGFDLVNGDVVRRLVWPIPVDGPGAIRDAMIHLAHAARQAPV